MGSPGPTRQQGDLADVVEMLLEKGVVINADVAVSIGDTELLGIQVRAALASFETAAQYGLEFPEGTDRERIEAAASGGARGRVGRGSEGAQADEEEASDADGPNRIGTRPHATAGEAGSGGGADRTGNHEEDEDADD